MIAATDMQPSGRFNADLRSRGEAVPGKRCGARPSTWRAEWEQDKTGADTETGALWPEICAILDEWGLDGAPIAWSTCRELVGRNWLTLESHAPHRNLPTVLTKAAIGVPSHDLRTLAADYMRRHDPAHAADVIATHLGHGTRNAGEAYRAECEGTAAQAMWTSARKAIAARSVKKAKQRSRQHGTAGL